MAHHFARITSFSHSHIVGILMLFGLSLVSCGSDSSSPQAGGGIETTNGGLAVRGTLTLADGSVAHGGRIAARRLDDNRSTESNVEADGSFRIALDTTGHWVLIANDGALQASINHLLVSEFDTTRPIEGIDMNLNNRINLSAAFTCGKSACGGAIDLPELGIFGQEVGSSFQMPSVPADTLQLRFRSSDGLWFFDGRIIPDNATSLSLAAVNRRMLVLDDFEQDDQVHSATFFPKTEGHWQWQADDATASPNPACLPCVTFSDTGNALRAITPALYNENYYEQRLLLALRSVPDTDLPAPRWGDLSGLTTLRVRMLGTGRVRLELWTIQNESTHTVKIFKTTLGLPAQWTDHALSLSQFADDKGATPTVLDLTRTAALVFAIPPSTDIWIDDIRLEGTTLTDLR